MNIEKDNFSQWYNAIIKEAELCDLRYGIKGFVVFQPWSVMTMNRMFRMMENEIESRGHVPALFPALIPERYLTKEGEHVEGFVPETLWVTEGGSDKLEERYAMRPTSETAMYSMYSLWIHGSSDLPLKLYQRCQVWRYETKATKPFIRSREFYWIEAHDCFATEKDALAQVCEDMEMSKRVIHWKYGIPFLFFKRPQWDKFPGAVNTYAADTLMPDGKALQLPSTHMLGQNFSKAFDISFTDENGEKQYVWQTCYGPAISRIYAALISMHGDKKGLVLPFDLAPLQIVIVPIFKDETENLVLSECRKLKNELLTEFSVKIDETDNTPGFKYNHWEMKGVPIRIELGPRDIEKDSAIIVRRDEGKKKQVPLSEIKDRIRREGKEMQENLIEKADSWFGKRIGRAGRMEDLNSMLESGYGFIRVPFCSDNLDGQECADAIKERFSVDVRGSLYINEEKPRGEKCISCQKEAKIYLYVARQY